MKRDILIIISLFSVAFLIRAVNLSNVCLVGDEWLYSGESKLILANGFVPIAQVFEYSSPFLSYIGAVFILLHDGALNTLRMVSVIFGSLTVPALYLFGKTIYDRKTGLLSALFLCFSTYHIFYSRIFMQEALTIFFITAFLYFFWLSQRSEGRKSNTYAIIAGVMVGLAIDAKYLPFFLVPVVLAYILWIKKFDFKALLDKRIILLFVFAFFVVAVLIMCWYYTGIGPSSLYFQAFGRFEKASASNIQVQSFPVLDLLIGAGENMVALLARGTEFLIYPWSVVFTLSAILLFFITLLFYLPKVIIREEKGSFLLISISIVLISLLKLANKQYYMMYSFPFYFVMLSHLVVNSFYNLRSRKERSPINILRILTILLAIIVLFSYFFTGITSPYWDAGDYSWTEGAVHFIKNDVAKNQYEKHILIGTTTMTPTIDYPIYPYDYELEASTISILSCYGNEFVGEKYYLDLEKIGTLNPDYIITNEQRYGYYFTGNAGKEILDDYQLVFCSRTKPYKSYVLKRKNIRLSNSITPEDGKDGDISSDIFEKTVPDIMEIGKVYTALVPVKNTGDSRTIFSVNVYSKGYAMYIEGPLREIVLERGSTSILKFKIVPTTEYAGELPITADLCVKYKDEGKEVLGKKVDSVTDYVCLIKK